MNNDSNFSIIGDEPVEARIVAWVLGEASGFEAGELERLCAERPELLVFRRRMRALHGLLTEAEAAQPDDGWKLPPEKRKALDEVVGCPEPVRIEPVLEKRVRHAARRALLSIAACVLLTFVVLFFIPSDSYESEAVIEVKPRSVGVSMFGVPDASSAPAKQLNPQFFATEVEMIKSRRNLEQVADNLSLDKRWGVDRETAIRKLKDSIRTENVKGTDLMSIRARANDPEDAKQIASEVTKSYKHYRNQIEAKEEEHTLAELNKAVRDQEDKVEERRKLLATIANTKGIIYKGQDSFYNQGGIDEDQGARQALQEYEKLESEKLQLKTQVESLRKYDADQLAVYAAGLDLPDNGVRAALPKFQEEQRKIESLKVQGLAENHPTLKDAEKNLAEAKSQLEEGVTNLRATLDAKLELADNRLKEVEKRKGQTREEAIKRGLDAQDYADAKRDFEADQEVLQNLKLKKVAADIGSRVPFQSVEVHDDPIQGEPERKSVASNLLGKVSSLGSVLSGKGRAEASKEAPALASRSSAADSKFAQASERAESLPASRGMIVDRAAKTGPVAADEGRLARNAPATTPAKPLPPAMIEGAPKPINVPNLELAQSGPARLTLLAEESKSMESKFTVGGAATYAGAASHNTLRAAEPQAKAVEEPIAQVQPSTPPVAKANMLDKKGASVPAIPVPDVNVPAPSVAFGDGKDFGGGWGGAPADQNVRDGRDVAEVDLKEHFTGYAGATKAGAGTLDLSGRDVVAGGLKKDLADVTVTNADGGQRFTFGIRADSERKPAEQGAGWFVGDEGLKARAREDVSEVDEEVPTLGELPALGRLLSKNKEEAAPESGLRSGDHPVSRKSIDEILNNPDPTGNDFDGFVNYGSPIAGEKGAPSALAEREIARRKSAEQNGDRLLMEGREAYQKGDYQQAFDKYSQSIKEVPDSPKFAEKIERFKEHQSDAALALAMQHRKVGKYSEARALLDDVLAKNPDNASAKTERSYLEDPIRSSPALTYENNGNADDVRRNLYMAEGNMNLGKFDAAKKKYEDTLRIDPNNAAARKGMEQVAAAKSAYYRAAYDHTRAELLMAADKAWEDSVPADQKDEKAGLKVIREFNYPTEYEPAAPPSDITLDGATLPVTPASSDAFVVPPAPAKPDLAKLMEEISASDDPYSTFSLNISDASFKIAQAALAKGERPDPAGVKVEQFYNAVDYGDPAPSGAEPVALASEQCAHPVIPGRDLVRVAVKTAAAGRSAAQPLRLTLLVDQSGSMVRADRRDAMAEALSGLAGLLTANDKVTLIGFSRAPHLLADGMSGSEAGKLPGMVHQEAAEGGTNLEEAIKLAAQLAARHKLAGAQNRIVLFTDGAANLGDADPARLAGRVKNLRQAGFAFDVAGIAADDLNDELLGELARNGNGRYYIVGKGGEGGFAQRLAGAFRPAAENVKVQVRFNPERVARYKLIGFEKDRLKTEDFRNDAVDAAEMAAEEAGVAIYQVETIPGGSGELGEVSVRFRDAARDTMVERTMALPHAASTPAIDKASPSMQLAVLSMLAAEKLRGGPLGDAVDFSNLNGPRGNVRAFFGPGSRAAEMLQVIDSIK